MSVGNVAFYNLRGSLSTGEYPLLSGSETPVHTQSNIVYRKGLVVNIDVPIFDGYDSVNIAKIDGLYYWITSYKERTTVNGQISMTLDFMPPTSLISYGDSISVYLERSPTYLCQYLTDNWTNGEMTISDAQNLGLDMTYNSNHPMYWVQITGVDTNGDFKRYGCFVYSAKLSLWDYGQMMIDFHTPAPNGEYPSIKDIINDVATITPFTAESVKDISISRRCPYVYTEYVDTNTHKVKIGPSDYTLLNPSKNGSSDYVTYSIDDIPDLAQFYINPANPRTITFTASEQVKMSGNYIIRDWNKNIIATFPVAEGSTFYTLTYGDFSGIYTMITNGKRLITIPEGKLPYGGSGWDTYLAYSMTADRQAMNNAIGYADRERMMQIVGGTADAVINGAITGAFAGSVAGPAGGAIGAGLGVITGGISAVSNALESQTKYSVELERLTDAQKLNEIRAKNAIGTGYNVGYGVIYVSLTAGSNNLVIGPELPINNGSTLLTDYVARNGYPCEGLKTITAGYGYYRGWMPSTSNGGMLFNALNQTFRRGFKFVQP